MPAKHARRDATHDDGERTMGCRADGTVYHEHDSDRCECDERERNRLARAETEADELRGREWREHVSGGHMVAAAANDERTVLPRSHVAGAS